MTESNQKNYYSETSKFSQTWLIYVIVPVGVIPMLVAIITLLQGGTSGSESLISFGIGLFAFSLIMALLFVLKLEVRINNEGINFRFFPMQIKFKVIKFDEIAEYQIRKYSPIFEYGGWGIRYAFSRGWAYNVSGNIGLQLVKKDNKRILIGTNKPDEFFAVLDNCIKKRK
jgi:hypothetical protein